MRLDVFPFIILYIGLYFSYEQIEVDEAPMEVNPLMDKIKK